MIALSLLVEDRSTKAVTRFILPLSSSADAINEHLRPLQEKFRIDPFGGVRSGIAVGSGVGVGVGVGVGNNTPISPEYVSIVPPELLAKTTHPTVLSASVIV
jgi:hypothetical protein